MAGLAAPGAPLLSRFHSADTLKGTSTMSVLATATSTATPATIDLRGIAPRDRHALVFSGFDALPAGQAMQLVNDHDPLPLRFQFDDRSPSQFEWAALESGPDVWRVQITRVGTKPSPAANGSCCSGGACCG